MTDPSTTTVVLVTRPDPRPMQEAARTAEELRALGRTNQRLVINAVFHAARPDDAVASEIEALGRDAIAAMPDALASLPRDEVPMRPLAAVDRLLHHAHVVVMVGDTYRNPPANRRPQAGASAKPASA